MLRSFTEECREKERHDVRQVSRVVFEEIPLDPLIFFFSKSDFLEKEKACIAEIAGLSIEKSVSTSETFLTIPLSCVMSIVIVQKIESEESLGAISKGVAVL